MTKMQRLIVAAIVLVGGLTRANSASAVVLALDTAADPAYVAEEGGAWKGTNPGEGENPPGNDNGGFGFLPWSFGGGYHAGGTPYNTTNHFIDGVDFPTTSYNNLGSPAFGLGNEQLAGFGITAAASRPFVQPLAVGDIFSAEIDTPAEYDDYSGFEFPFAIITFNDAAGMGTIGIEAGSSLEYGDFPWRFTDATRTDADFGVEAGASSIAPTAPSDGSLIKLELTSNTTARITLDGVPLDVTLQNGAPSSVTFTLFDNNAEADNLGSPTGEHAFYFDTLKIERPGGIAGDYNGTGKVDAADYTRWRDNLGAASEANLNNNGNGGDVAASDYDYWKSRFGNTSGAGSVGGSAVPEPHSLLALLVGAAAAVGLGRYRRFA